LNLKERRPFSCMAARGGPGRYNPSMPIDPMNTGTAPWPWYVSGPLIGLFVPILLLVGNKLFGVSSNFRHMCSALGPKRGEFFRYDWRQIGGWNLAFATGILAGGVIAHLFLDGAATVALSPSTQQSLHHIGIHDLSGLMPRELFSWHALSTLRGAVLLIGGGFLVGFGTAYAGGCTSGHGVSGLANFQLPSLIAVVAFFVGGVFGTWVLLPLLLGA
jgi:uncharacterized membrane protein YedE/YeeE